MEVILDLREIVGEPSGENLAAVVWQTIVAYGLENKVCQNGTTRLALLLVAYSCMSLSCAVGRRACVRA